MAQKAFSELATPEELKAYLDRPFQYVRTSVFHYTSLGSLLAILRSRTLRFSSFDGTNDQTEAAFVNDETRRRFFFCLMRSMEESFGMWAMYGGLPQKGKDLDDSCVKVEIPVPELRRFMERRGLAASTVAYTRLVGRDEGKNHVITCGTCVNSRGIAVEPKGILSGYIKDSAWRYEREVRLWSAEQTVALDGEFVGSISVMPSPLSSGEEILDLIRNSEYADLLPEVEPRLRESRYRGSFSPRKAPQER